MITIIIITIILILLITRYKTDSNANTYDSSDCMKHNSREIQAEFGRGRVRRAADGGARRGAVGQHLLKPGKSQEKRELFVRTYIRNVLYAPNALSSAAENLAKNGLSPVSITRFPLTRLSPGAGLLRNRFFHR